MSVIPFVRRRDLALEAAIAELEAALDGDSSGAAAEAWRELRADVRSLPAPPDPIFVERLRTAVPSGRGRRGGHTVRPRVALAVVFAVCVAALVTAGAVFSGSNGGSPRTAGGSASRAAESTAGAAASRAARLAEGTPDARTPKAGTEVPGAAPARLQQLAASITLGAGSDGVQAVADRAGRLAVAVGGFVESSRVQREQGSAGEAVLALKVPSARLANVLAQLQALAPVRAETQSLQDVTSEYQAAGRRVQSLRAERDALLRALAHAETPAALESLHVRIAQANSEIAAAQSHQTAIARSAGQAQVEVTVVGEASGKSGGLTLSGALRDAGDVLATSLAVLVIAVAVLIPAALLLAAVIVAVKRWRRTSRERALSA